MGVGFTGVEGFFYRVCRVYRGLIGFISGFGCIGFGVWDLGFSSRHAEGALGIQTKFRKSLSWHRGLRGPHDSLLLKLEGVEGFGDHKGQGLGIWGEGFGM